MARTSTNTFRWYGDPAIRAVDFGMKDAKGRAIGAKVSIMNVRVEVNTSEWSGYPVADQHEIGAVLLDVTVNATRDGRRFGAAQGGRLVEDGAEAKTEIHRRLTSMIKRYAKKANLLADGCHARWVDKQTGRLLTVRDNEDQDDAVPYQVVCEEHSTLVGVESKASGRSCSGLDFCDDCRDAARSTP